MNTSTFPRSWLCSVFVTVALWCTHHSMLRADTVRVSEQELAIPTYLAGDPEPNPMFYFGGNSQGAQGRVYPYPLFDNLTHTKSNKVYRVIYLENEYVRIGVLPEIGGRLFEAVDKSNGYNWVYRQHVIKPALIGLIGAWMSGGVEWNIPHHHRATTFLPVQYHTEEEADGSKTVWVGELEIRHRMRWAVGYTLFPGKSYLTAKVRILNRTPVANTMLCFANLAVHANEQYQIIFPPDTQFVTHHAKREFAAWPIATGRYAGADFGSGTDVSWYSNHFSANSMFAWESKADFFGGYDHGKQAGTLSIADHYVVPGKKFWTWGSGPRGRMWDKILTDSDGPYIELMTGAFSDNQPDYSWLQPFETKSFELHWYPFRDIDGAKNANLDAAVNLESTTDGTAKVGFCTTAAYRSATVLLNAGDKVLFQQGNIGINPGRPYIKTVRLPSGLHESDLRASLSAEGRELIAYSPPRLEPRPMPEAITPPPEPKDVKTIEELYLVGLRIEQFYAPGREPTPYWEEALRRDPGDAQVNTVLGIRQLKEAKYEQAEQHLRAALARLTANYTAPKNGEPLYYLGVALQAQGKSDQAFDAFYKAAWSEAWRDPAYFSLAEIAAQQGQFATALDYVNRSLDANALNVRALTLKAALLRHLERRKEALDLLHVAARKTDPLDVGLMAERWLEGDRSSASELTMTLRDHPQNGLEAAAEYGNAGLWQDGTAVLKQMVDVSKGKGHVSPLAYYYLGHFSERMGDSQKAAAYREQAARMSPDYVFPFQWELMPVLRHALEANPGDAHADYYLGNLSFDSQPEQALSCWEKSAELDSSFSIVHRNLAIAHAHWKPTNDVSRAIAELEKAVALPGKYALHFKELDELYAKTGKPPEQRLALLEQNQAIVAKRDDALSREIGLKVFAGKYDEAIQLMTGRTFSVWEGGTLDVAEHWFGAHLLRGERELAAHKPAAALADFQAAVAIPDNLPSDAGAGRGHEAEIAYWSGLAHAAMGDPNKATECWQRATPQSREGRRRVGSGGRSESDPSAERYYVALAQRKLGQNEQADTVLKNLLEAAMAQLERTATPSQEAQIGRRSRPSGPAFSHYLAGLAHLGLGHDQEAKEQFTAALAATPDLLRAKVALDTIR
jgi:tetratricopeptide (TPR) repeat protein